MHLVYRYSNYFNENKFACSIFLTPKAILTGDRTTYNEQCKLLIYFNYIYICIEIIKFVV